MTQSVKMKLLRLMLDLVSELNKNFSQLEEQAKLSIATINRYCVKKRWYDNEIYVR